MSGSNHLFYNQIVIRFVLDLVCIVALSTRIRKLMERVPHSSALWRDFIGVLSLNCLLSRVLTYSKTLFSCCSWPSGNRLCLDWDANLYSFPYCFSYFSVWTLALYVDRKMKAFEVGREGVVGGWDVGTPSPQSASLQPWARHPEQLVSHVLWPWTAPRSCKCPQAQHTFSKGQAVTVPGLASHAA